MNNTVYQTFRGLINLCRLRASPAELPYSMILLVLLIIIELGLNVFTLNQLKGASSAEVFLASTLSLGVLIGLIFVLLAQRKVATRLPKVLTAWFGTELLLTLLLKLILLVIPESLQATKAVQAVLQIIFFTWNVAIKAYIFRRSCDFKLASALLITFGFLIVSSLPIQFILGTYLQQTLPEASTDAPGESLPKSE